MKFKHLIYFNLFIVFNYMTEPQFISPLPFYLHVACIFYYNKSAIKNILYKSPCEHEPEFICDCVGGALSRENGREKWRDIEKKRVRQTERDCIWRKRFLKWNHWDVCFCKYSCQIAIQNSYSNLNSYQLHKRVSYFPS